MSEEKGSSLHTLAQFIDYNSCKFKFARFVLSHMRMEEPRKSDFAPYMAQFKLKAVYAGHEFDVTGVSESGYVTLLSAADASASPIEVHVDLIVAWVEYVDKVEAPFPVQNESERDVPCTFRDVDDFIDYAGGQHTYARWVLNHFRWSAVLQFDFAEFMAPHKLFCDFEGERYRVTGASRLGDIWLTKKFDQSTGYQKRECPTSLTNWGPEP